MRRVAFGLLTLLAAIGLVFTASCQRDGALRIISINDGEPLMSDIVDFGEITIQEDPEEPPEIYQFSMIPEDVVEIELQYVEIGLGLPTWTPYQAHIQSVTIDYEDAGVLPGEGTEYGRVVLGMDLAVMSDHEGKKTEAGKFTLVPAQWKEFYFGDEAQDAPEDDDYGVVATLTATVTVQGIDDVSGEQVKAKADADVVIGNFWDEPTRLGQ